MKTEIEILIEKWESELGSYIPNAPIYEKFINEAKKALKKDKNMEQKKDGRGSGSKKNVGRKKLTYETKTVYKKVPESIHDLCCSLVDAEVLKYKLKNK